MPQITKRLERGQGLVEYALILVLVALAVIIGLTIFGQDVNDLYDLILTEIQNIT